MNMPLEHVVDNMASKGDESDVYAFIDIDINNDIAAYELGVEFLEKNSIKYGLSSDKIDGMCILQATLLPQNVLVAKMYIYICIPFISVQLCLLLINFIVIH